MTADALARLLGQSPALEQVRRCVTSLLAHGSPRLPALLIEGETGTGKGLLARALHEASPRGKARFVDVNCAAIPESLLEAELFGYAAGAFSSARRAKPGLITLAHGGTLFLDELGALPLALQAKLLTAVEEQHVRPLGSTRAQPLDVWVLSATSEGLEAAVRTGRFRGDLYHRLARLSLKLPTLRERGADVLLLARHFLARAAREHGVAAKTLAPDASAALQAYSWPGNVRELANLMERLTLLADGPTITVATLELPTQVAAARPPATTDVEPGATHEVAPLRCGKVAPAAPRRRRSPVDRTAPPVEAGWRLRRVAVLRSEPTAQALDSPALAARWQAVVRDKVATFGGIVDEQDDSGLLACFGLEPSEDAPVRAAHAAVAAVAALRRVLDGITPVIAAIDVLEGRVGERGRRGVLHPEDVQSARDRLRAALAKAQPGDVLATAAALPHLERAFDDAPLADAGGAVRLVKARGSFARTSRRTPSTFVGRHGELVWLTRQVERLEAGQGRAIGLIGEPGAGKSRLLHEVHQVAASLGVPWLEGRCVDHGTATPYLPLVDLLRRSAGVEEPDDAAAVLGGRLQQAGLDPEQDGAFLERLLGLPGGDWLARLSPETIRTKTFEVLRRLIQPGPGPIVIAIEDIHWIDRTSEAFLGSLVDAMPAAPLLLVTYRAGYHPPWIDRSSATQLPVRPLDSGASRTIVSDILRTRRIDEAATDRLVQQAEGNPFFLEELAWCFGSPEASDAGVPRTIRDALAAGIDRLPAGPQRLLETASVLGREAPARLLDGLVDDCDARAGDFDALIAREFIYENRGSRGTVYAFKHALIQEVAYARLPPRERARLHTVVGRELERLHAGALDTVLPELAHHWSRSGNDARAVDYLMRVADRAAANHALDEALAALDRGLRHAERLPTGLDRELATLGCVVRMGVPLLFIGRGKDALELLVRYRERLEAVQIPALEGPYHFVLSGLYDHIGDLALAFKHSQLAIDAADRCGDVVTKGRAYIVRAHTHLWRGELIDAVGAAEQALAALLPTTEQFWIGMAYWILGLNHFQIGDLTAAEDAGRRLLFVAETHADRRLECYAGCILGMVQACREGSTAAVDLIARAKDAAPDPLARSVALFLLGAACLETGDPEQARDHLRGSLELLHDANVPQIRNWAASFMVVANIALGNTAEGHELGNRVLASTGERQFPQARARVFRALAGAGDGRSKLTEALRLFALTGARLEAARTRVDLASVPELTDVEREEHLQVARDTFRAVGSTRDAREAERSLMTLRAYRERAT